MLGQIDAEDIVLCFMHSNAQVVIEEAELLELFGVLDRAGLHVSDSLQSLSRKSVEAYVFVKDFIFLWRRIAVKRDGAPREQQGKALMIAHNFCKMRTYDLFRTRDLIPQCPDIALIRLTTLQELCDHLFGDEGLIPLPVDPNVGIDLILAHNLDQAVRSRRALWRCHVINALKGIDEVRCFTSIDCKGDMVEYRDFFGLVPHALKKGLSSEHL